MAYTGVMGSGKSYEAVSTAALTAFRAGRRVVTNISGFNFEAIRDYIGALPDGSMLEPEKVVVIHSKRITEPNFFFDPDIKEDSVVMPGDLVLIDEVWAFWGTDTKLLADHQKFFRMHRHYTELATGISCDLVIMIQDLSSLNRFIKGVLESNLKFTKMKTLGLMSRYRVEVYEGNKQRKASLVAVNVKKYNKDIFPLYKSYDAGAGKESVVDGRQNLFHNKLFLFVMFASVVGLIAGSWWFYGYVMNLQSGGKVGDKKPGIASPASSVAASAGISALPGQLSVTGPVLSDGRLIGLIEHGNGEATAVFQLEDGKVVRQRMNGGVIDGWQSSAAYQGSMAGFSFSGSVKGK